MDNRTFDNVSRLIGSGATRRRVVGALIAAVGGAVAVGSAPASAVQRPTCRVLAAGCTRANQCCSGFCERRTSVPRRKRFRCGCGDGLTQCGTTCHDLDTDAGHCSDCFLPCPETTDTCLSGACSCGGSAPCPDGDICCDGICYDKFAEKNHCGTCGNSCDGGYCDGGVCAPLVCGDQSTYPAGWVQACVGLVNGEELFICGSGDQSTSTCRSSADCDAFRVEKAASLIPGATAAECVSVRSEWDATRVGLIGPSPTEGYCLVYSITESDGTCGSGPGE